MAGKDLKDLVVEELENKERKALKAQKKAERQRQKEERAQQKIDAAQPKKMKHLNKVFERFNDKQIAAALSDDHKITINFWRRLAVVSEYEMMQTPGFKKLQDRLAPSFAKVSYIATNYCQDHILTADVLDLISGQTDVRDQLIIGLKWNKEKFFAQAEKQKRSTIM
jgi:hypothetical protein